MNDTYKTPNGSLDVSTDNNSGQGKVDAYPDGVKGWSWGAFLLNWIWALGNRTWIGLLALIPYVGIIMSVVLGRSGPGKTSDSVEPKSTAGHFGG